VGEGRSPFNQKVCNEAEDSISDTKSNGQAQAIVGILFVGLDDSGLIVGIGGLGAEVCGIEKYASEESKYTINQYVSMAYGVSRYDAASILYA
jgi:hypothetical protein